MQSVKPPVEAPMSTQGRPGSKMDQWARACSSLRPPRLTYLRSEPRRRMEASAGMEAPGLSMRCSLTRTRPARMRAWARSRDAAWPLSTRSLSRRIFSWRSFGGLVLVRFYVARRDGFERCIYLSIFSWWGLGLENRRLEADLKVIWKLIWAGKLHWS